MPEPDLPGLLDRELLIVTGKGGVGKSTVAAALALVASASGKRVLAVELDAKGDLLACLAGAGASGGRQDRPLGYEPRQITPGLWAMAMDPEESLKEYLRSNLRIPIVTRVGALSQAFDFLANAGPGVREIVTIGKVAFDVREQKYDLVIVDATSTGHVVSQLDAPRAINELVGAGLIRSQTAWIEEILTNPRRTGVVAVTVAEETPVSETMQLLDTLRTMTGVDVAAVVLNRLPPAVDAQRSPAANPAFRTAVALAEGIATRADDQVRRLVAHVDAHHASADVLTVPMLFDAEPGMATTRAVADTLELALFDEAEP